MLRYLKQSWNDISKGENLELYITVIASIIITFLGLFGYANSEIVSSVILSTLGLIAGSLLSNRKIMNEVNSSASKLSNGIDYLRSQIKSQTYDAMTTAFSEIENEVRNDTIQIDKVELIQHSSECAHRLILAFFDRGVEKIDLYLQDLSIARELCEDATGERRIKDRAIKYELNIRDYNYKGDFKLYFYCSPASLNAVRITTSNKQEIILLGWYTYSHESENPRAKNNIYGGNNPCIKIDSSHPNFRHFKRLFENQIKKFESQSKIRFNMKDGQIKDHLNLDGYI